MSTLTLEDVADYLEGFHKYQNYGMALCCWHDDKNPSMQVTDHGYKCFSCGAHGSLEKLYREVSGRIVTREKKYNPAQKIWYKWFERYGSVQTIAKVAHTELLFNPDLGHYLKQRKIDTQIRLGKLGYLDGYYTFPVRNEYEEVVGIVARASPTIQTKQLRYTVSPNCPQHIYVPNWRTLLKSDALYLCYGTIDAWTLHMAGYAGITGISGQEFDFHNLDQFRKPIFIIPDKGEEINAGKLQCNLNWRGRTVYLKYPEGTKDLSGVHMEYGLDTVSKLIEKAKEKYVYN